MLHLASYDIVFQEIPGEVTLALNISGCPNNCPGCHSPHLQKVAGELLGDNLLSGLLKSYGDAVTCICFMGGDAEPLEVKRLAAFVRTQTNGRLKVGWYSGKASVPDGLPIDDFNFIKLGAYVERLGGLNSETTNQRLYKIEHGKWVDVTYTFK